MDILSILFLLRLAGVLLFWWLITEVLLLSIKALRKYVSSKPVREEKNMITKSLGEVLKSHRTSCGMTQEFVAEKVGVSRQAVSKWENGSSEPSTSNLIQLANLFGVAPEDLLRETKENT